ncbi:S41 family peptidase [Luteimicrobium sp. DT211]|uniref:S41 family peptidase n=1 Tax=Luteimicrobium sp. DT211 TaxID=3393412 RepID=UPI003CFA06F8
MLSVTFQRATPSVPVNVRPQSSRTASGVKAAPNARTATGRTTDPASLLRLRHAPAAGDGVRFDQSADHFPAGLHPFHGRMLVLVDGGTASSGESTATMLRDSLGARIVGGPTWA